MIQSVISAVQAISSGNSVVRDSESDPNEEEFVEGWEVWLRLACSWSAFTFIQLKYQIAEAKWCASEGKDLDDTTIDEEPKVNIAGQEKSPDSLYCKQDGFYPGYVKAWELEAGPARSPMTSVY